MDAYIGRLESSGSQDREHLVRVERELAETRELLNALTLKGREEFGSLNAQVDSLKAELKEKDEDTERLETDLARMREWGEKYKKRYAYEKLTGEKYLLSEPGNERLAAVGRGAVEMFMGSPAFRGELTRYGERAVDEFKESDDFKEILARYGDERAGRFYQDTVRLLRRQARAAGASEGIISALEPGVSELGEASRRDEMIGALLDDDDGAPEVEGGAPDGLGTREGDA